MTATYTRRMFSPSTLRTLVTSKLTCPRCGSARALIAMITQRSVIERIVDHLDLPSALPLHAAARAA